MLKEERYHKILEIIASDGKITVVDIVRLFEVSDMTARRDIKLLAIWIAQACSRGSRQ